ncbi:hypothetical protein BDV93DRAFT_544547 [Ceratobasidium sp. AG-I]|nr:hypothetical protein BDV93DRAFT_544547 [Ceratobasidium sp. AG-I]
MSSHTSSSSLAVLNIPELVTHICEVAHPADCARLLRVSRLFFFCGAPSVWKDIYGVTKLFSLLECTATREESPQTRKSNVVIKLPEQPDFSRFDYYSKLVKKLEVFERRCDILVFEDWPILNSHVASRGQPLLPNLIELACREAPSDQCHNTIMNWINLFLTPNLVELRVPNPNGDICAMFTWLAPLLVSNMLESVSSRCPSLKTLEVSPGTTEPNAVVEFNIPTGTGLHEHISRFDSLRTLVTSAAALEPGMLTALGQLPKLEALSIVSSHQHEPTMRLVPLSREAFPALTRLELRRLSLRAIMALWHTPRLVENLSSVSIAQPILDDWTPRNWAGELISHVCRQSPHLREFYLDPYYYASQVVYLSNNDLFLLKDQSISLHSLTLCGTRMDADISNQDLASAFPHLRVLRLPSWRITWHTIRDLATRLPMLSTLSVGLDQWHTSVPMTTSCVSSNALSLELNWTFSSHQPVVELAEFLCATWPAVQCAFLPGLNLDKRSIGSLQKLNEAVANIRRDKRKREVELQL